MINAFTKDIFHEIILKINDKSLKLASLPDIIIKINEVITDDRKGIKDVAAIAQRDVSLSTRLIGIANSPAVRGNSPVTSVEQAVNRLGIEFVKNLALCVSLKDRFSLTKSRFSHAFKEVFAESDQHALYGYCLCKALTPDLKPEVAFVIGLVGAVGRLVTLRYIHDYYPEMSEDAAASVAATIGEDVTEAVLRIWEFPNAIVSAIYSSKIPELTRPESYNDIYRLAQEHTKWEKKQEPAITSFQQFVVNIIDNEKDDAKLLLY